MPLILIVDDQATNVQLVANLLQAEGYDLAAASGGAECLTRLRQRDFDLVLLDIMMPEMDGFEVARHMKTDPALAHIPLIFLTAKTDEESLAQAFGLGAADFLTKPIRNQELVVRVKTQLLLAENQRRMQEDAATKNRFFNIMAHDLKSPFNALVGLSEILLQNLTDMPPAEVRELLVNIHAAAKNGAELTEQLLNWARAQTGRLQMALEILETDLLQAEALSAMAELAQAKNVRLTTRPSGLLVYADYNMLGSVLRNLLSNAIKFSHPGQEVTVRSQLASGKLQIWVEDQGVGMRPEQLKQLFRLDQPQSTPGTAGEQGTGLGLILCKEFLAQMQGGLGVESTLGQGTRFCLSLPLPPAGEPG